MGRRMPNPQTPRSRSLVAGGAGFIGSYLCERLLNDEHEVICADSLLTGSEENIAHLIDNEGFTFIERDIIQPIALESLSSKIQHPTTNTQHLNYIFHLASPASPIDYLNLPLETLRAGSIGTLNLLELAREHNATFLLASTSEVYGDPSVNPQEESYWGNVNPIGPRSVYDESKRFSEAATMAYHRTYGLDTRIARIFNTYGPRMRGDDGRAVPTFIIQALQNQPMTVFGDGCQTRSFCYVDDLVDGLVRLLLRPGIHDPVNLGNPDEISILDLVKETCALTESSSIIEFKPLPVDDPKLRQPDIGRAADELGWCPSVLRSEGLKRTIAYFQEAQRSNKVSR